MHKTILRIILGAFTLWIGFPNKIIHIPLLALFFPLMLAQTGRSANDAFIAFKHGLYMGILGRFFVLYWLALPLHNVGELPLPFAYLLAFCIASFLALFDGFFSYIAQKIKNQSILRFSAICAILWYIFEEISARILGFPWLTLASSFVPLSITLQLANIIGAYALSCLWIFAILNICLPEKNNYSHQIVGIVIICTILSYGIFSIIKDHDLSNPIQVLFVEGNIDQNQKWDPKFQRQTVEHYLNLTNKGLSKFNDENTEKLIIWPETALPYFFGHKTNLDTIIYNFIKNEKIPLLFGAPALENEKTYNRAFLINNSGEIVGTYDKEHLVPFGEYLPPFLNWPFLEKLLQGVGVYSEGYKTEPLKVNKLALGILICYEGIFPSLASKRVENGANILVDISNDGWFEKSPAAKQHLYLTVLRAIEENRYILRGTNTGISASIDNKGHIITRGEQFKTGSIIANAYLFEEKSIFHNIADYIPITLCLLLFILFKTANKKRI